MARSRDSINIILRSSASPHFYTTKKPKRDKEKLRLKKFDPTKTVRKHVEYVEEKMK